VVSLEFQSVCFAFRSPSNVTENPPLRHSDRCDCIKGRLGVRYAAASFTGLIANSKCMAVASRCCKSGTGTA
jgi:hypothetical protein